MKNIVSVIGNYSGGIWKVNWRLSSVAVREIAYIHFSWVLGTMIGDKFSSVTQSYPTLWPPWTARLHCPSPTPWACSDSCPSSRWCHPTISSSVVPFSSCPQSSPGSGSFPVTQFFASGGQSIGASASVSVLLMNIQCWFPLELTGLISLQSKGLSNTYHPWDPNSVTYQKACSQLDICYSPYDTEHLPVGGSVEETCTLRDPRHFWYQASISWETIFLWTWEGRGWFGDDSSTFHLLCALFLLLLQQGHLKLSSIRSQRLGTPALDWGLFSLLIILCQHKHSWDW